MSGAPDFAAKVAAEKARIKALEPRFRIATIPEIMREACADHGGRVLLDVFDRGERATYAEAGERTNRIANALGAQGVSKGDRVAVMLPNRIDYPLIWLALAKIGAVHVPVNTRYTPREIGYAVNDSGAAFAIVDESHIETFLAMEGRPGALVDGRIAVAGGGAKTGLLDFAALCASAPATPAACPGLAPGDLMNIQYTSGTTGFPKGCKLSHRYWLTLAQAALAWDAVAPSRMLTAQPFFYMDPQWHLLKAMLAGATLFMAPQLSSTRFIGWVKGHRVDWCQFPILMTRQRRRATTTRPN